MLSRANFLIGLLLVFCWQGIQGQERSPLESMSYDPLIASIMDNPSKVKAWARDVLSRDKNSVDPLLRMHGLIAFIIASNELSEMKDIDSVVAELSDAASLAKHKGLGAEHIKLLLLNMDDRLRASLLRKFHTCKGNARSLGLKYLASAIHDLEEALSHRESGSETDGRITSDFTQLQIVLKDYDHVLFKFFKFSLNRHESAGQTSLAKLVGEHFDDIVQRFKQHSIDVEGIDMMDRFLDWDMDLGKAVSEILIHGLSNSADHGFILPRLRGEESQAPQFQVSAEEMDHCLVLNIKDNGQGLDFHKIEKIAAQNGFQLEPGRPLTDVLFLDGASTCETTTRTRGRGVGLSVIQQICRDRDGSVSLLPNPEARGTMLHVVISLDSRPSGISRPA